MTDSAPATAALYCTDTDPEHIHDEDACCECGSKTHCCGGCPVYTPDDPDRGAR